MKPRKRLRKPLFIHNAPSHSCSVSDCSLGSNCSRCAFLCRIEPLLCCRLVKGWTHHPPIVSTKYDSLTDSQPMMDDLRVRCKVQEWRCSESGSTENPTLQQRLEKKNQMLTFITHIFWSIWRQNTPITAYPSLEPNAIGTYNDTVLNLLDDFMIDSANHNIKVGVSSGWWLTKLADW